MIEEIRKLLHSKVRDDYYLALNMINEDSISLFNVEEIYSLLREDKVDIEVDMDQLLRLKRVFSKIGFNFKIIEFI